MIRNTSLKTVNDYYENFINENDKNKEIIYFRKLIITIADFQHYVDLFTNHLINMGVKKGDRVAYTMPSRPECCYIFIALSRIGATALPLYYMIPDSVKIQILINTKIKLVITISDMLNSIKLTRKKMNAFFDIATIDGNNQMEFSFTKKMNPKINIEDHLLKEIEEDLPIMIGTSSGTTGSPKFVCMNHRNVATGLEILKSYVSPAKNYERPISSAVIFPLSTIEIITCMGMMFAGILQVFAQDISLKKFLEVINTWKVDAISGPPAFFENIVEADFDRDISLDSVKYIYTGNDFLQYSLVKKIKDKFKGFCGFSNGYGLIEASGIIMVNKVLDKVDVEKYSPNLMYLIEGVENQVEVRSETGDVVDIGEIGELYVKGKSVVNGYLNNNYGMEKNFINGWLKTGDIVKNEGHNKITLLGRARQLIKYKGKYISPIFVQKIINEIDGIKDSAVVGVRDDDHDEAIWAFVVLETGYELDYKDILSYCEINLVEYMIPNGVTFIKEIPKNVRAGKINFIKLKEMAKVELIKNKG